MARKKTIVPVSTTKDAIKSKGLRDLRSIPNTLSLSNTEA